MSLREQADAYVAGAAALRKAVAGMSRERLLARPVRDRSDQPVEWGRGAADDDGHGLLALETGHPGSYPLVSFFAKTPAAAAWQDRSRPDRRWWLA